MTTYSFTRLSAFERCPRRFKKIYIDEAPTTQTPAAAFGELLHACVARYLGEGADPQATFRGLFSESAAPLTWEHFNDGLDILKRFVESAESGGQNAEREILALEQKFDVSVNDVQLTGRIDRVDKVAANGIEVIDYKSSVAVPTREEVSSDFQLSIYCIAARELYPDFRHDEIGASIYLLRHGFTIGTKRSPESLAITGDYIASLVQRIEGAQDFEPKLNSYCLLCDFRFDCPAFKKAMTETPRAVTEDLFDLKSVAEEYEALKAAEKILSERKRELQDVLYVYAENHGEIEAGGMSYSLQTVLDPWRSDYDIDALWDYLVSIGVDPKRVVSVEQNAIGKVLNELKARMTKEEYNEAKDKIDSLRRKAYRTQLRATKIRR